MLLLYLAIAFLCAGLISVIIALVYLALAKHEKVFWALYTASGSMTLALMTTLIYGGVKLL